MESTLQLRLLPLKNCYMEVFIDEKMINSVDRGTLFSYKIDDSPHKLEVFHYGSKKHKSFKAFIKLGSPFKEKGHLWTDKILLCSCSCVITLKNDILYNVSCVKSEKYNIPISDIIKYKIEIETEAEKKIMTKDITIYNKKNYLLYIAIQFIRGWNIDYIFLPILICLFIDSFKIGNEIDIKGLSGYTVACIDALFILWRVIENIMDWFDMKKSVKKMLNICKK